MLRKMTLTIREAETAMSIGHGTFWKNYVDTGKIPVLPTGKEKPKYVVATHHIERHYDKIAQFPKNKVQE